MAQVLWNVVRKNRVFSNISDVEYLFCGQRNVLLPSNWPCVGLAANLLEKKNANPLFASAEAACQHLVCGEDMKSMWQDSFLGLFPLPSSKSVIDRGSHWWLSKAFRSDVCIIRASDNGVQSFALCCTSGPKAARTLDAIQNSAQIVFLTW